MSNRSWTVRSQVSAWERTATRVFFIALHEAVDKKRLIRSRAESKKTEVSDAKWLRLSDKPGSVASLGSPMVIYLGRQLLAASSDLPGSLTMRAAS